MRGLQSDSNGEMSRMSPATVWKQVTGAGRNVVHRYNRLSVKGKTALVSVSLINVGLLIAVIIITPTRIGNWFNHLAESLRAMGVGGMFICALFVVIASHPPLFGFMGSMTLIGFTYGVWPGFLVASLAALSGAAIAFISVRTFFLGWIRKRSNDKWEAFGHVMRNKGLPLVVMIRYCPLPWAMGNGLFASIESVKLWQYMIANLAILPKLLIPVFIGSRLTSLTHDRPSHDPLQFWLNIGSILLSCSISILTGIWIYRLTLEQMRKLNDGGDEGELAADALERGALLGDYTDDEEAADEPLTLGHSMRPSDSMLRRTSSSSDSR
ncbi:hypothetical protein BD324DRAFT_619269 [Kockovaella imperatae]|uniref:Golgi apparatus membrane protein TVP38 n=1 Tax=Kockovaella imperatae TaxID=4999 RepID=A0A1Y1UMT7_9TREE|nr:hypothetical protein BD324DRAFT_619269 [Kockovaella imperatae]ORX39329.1 hypothetical protein BD324DRAFT_619269 [Kockovaella imperatae]